MIDKNSKYMSPKIECNNCKDIIFSSFPGEFVGCKCRAESREKIDLMFLKMSTALPLDLVEEPNNHGFNCNVYTHLGRQIYNVLHKEYATGCYIDSSESCSNIFRWSGSFTEVVDEKEKED